MRVSALTTVAAFALAVAACGSNEGADQVSTEAGAENDAAANAALGTGMNAAAPSALPTDAAGFVNAMAASDLFELESAKFALEHGVSEQVKSLAQMLQREHSQSSADLKAAAAQANLTVTPALDAEKKAMIDALKAAHGADFDKAFLAQQRMAHQKALMLVQNYANSGDNDALKAFAAKVQPVIEFHSDRFNATPG